MEANELRIGNIIESGIVDGIHPNGVIEVINKNGAREFLHHLSLEKPEPLTEEWLLKFGFEQNSGIASREYLNNKTKINNHYENGYLFIMDYWNAGKMIKHVHQLQNLYFALTGEELKMTEHVN